MRLGFHYHIPARLENGKIYTLSLQGLFIDSLAPHFEKIILFLHTPVAGERVIDYELKSDNVELVTLGPHYSIPKRLLLNRAIRPKITQRVNDIDLLLMRAPTPLLPLITKDVKKKIKFAYLVVGEMIDHIDNIPQPFWRKGLLRQYILWNERMQQQYASEALVFANSAVVFDKYKKFSKQAIQIRTTTLKKSDFFMREDTCLGSTYQILYTGRIDRGKGMLEIVEAIGMLNKEGIDCVLNIVGWATPGDDITTLLEEEINKWNITDKVIFHGKKKVGEELFSFYKKADIFVLASQVAEGFPRTITEALAHSLPVVSTGVGSIERFHKHGHDIMIVEPRNSADIAEKIKEIINNPTLRKSLIKNGIQSVDEVTLEVQAERMATAIKNYTHQK